MDIDIPLPTSEKPYVILPPGVQPTYQYDPVTIFFEREDGYQYLVWFWNDGTVLHAERPDSSSIWSPPITGEKR